MIRTLAVTAVVLASCTPVPTSGVADRRTPPAAPLPQMNVFQGGAPDAPTRPNADLARDFMELTFRMESGRAIPVFTRYEGPITVGIAAGAPPFLSGELDRLITRLQTEAGLQIARVEPGAPAAITIQAVPRASMQRFVPEAACFVVPRISSWEEFRSARGGNRLDWTTLTTRGTAAVFVPSDVPPQEMRDCLHEEVAQALGPLNDLYRLPDSVFNDDNFHAVLTGTDMLMLRVTYDDALRSGMSPEAVAAALPGILARLNPRGQRGSGAPPRAEDATWRRALETALTSRGATQDRLDAAARAVQIARAAGWTDNRLAFSLFAQGRILVSVDAEASVAAFLEAAEIYGRIAPGGTQLAHVNMQLAAFALSGGEPASALGLVDAAVPVAMRHQNAALLATLLMIRAEALEATRRPAEARAARAEAVSWGRYAFGSDAAVLGRMGEVAALGPGRAG